MKSIKSKDLVKKLSAYFLENDPEVVARLLANMMLDLVRIYRISSLEPAEVASLLLRMKLNAEQVEDFAKNGSSGKLKMKDIAEGDEGNVCK